MADSTTSPIPRNIPTRNKVKSFLAWLSSFDKAQLFEDLQKRTFDSNEGTPSFFLAFFRSPSSNSSATMVWKAGF